MTKKVWIFLLLVALLTTIPPAGSFADAISIKLGNEMLVTHYSELLKDKRVGLVTNQTGVNSKGISTIAMLEQINVNLRALYAPEHGIDGKAPAGRYVESTTHPTLHIPVYSLYGKTKQPTSDMLKDIDVLLFDLQDIGARTYTYIS
ncbi:MAG: exo-beta-N-acetylmuramidase NamZ domain-containing protein, partial [Clostridia bacterium]